jgi:hypothetical protein
MGQKITQYPNNVSTNPDDLSLLDLSEKTGLSTYQSRKWTLTAFKAWVNSWVVATSVAWNNITGKPNVVDTTGGTVNYISKFTDENTIGNSQIQDDGTAIGFGVAPHPIAFRYSLQSTKRIGDYIEVTYTGGNSATSYIGLTNGINTAENVGGEFEALGSTYQNIGIKAIASGVNPFIGLFRDGSEGIGKFIKCITSDGKAKWAYVLSSDITEDTNLFFTEARVRQSILTGLSVTGSTILSTDSILVALGKLQNQLNAVSSAMIYQGTWDANTNTPTLASGTGTKGFVYRVNVSGSTNIDGITDWKAGDFIVFNGTTWDKWDATDAVTSVNGYTGVVTLGKGDVGLSNVVNTDTTTTSNISDSVDKRFVTDAEKTKLSNTSGTNSGDETASTIGTLINGSSTATPNDTDLVATAQSSLLKKITWANVKAFLKSYFDTLYAPTNIVFNRQTASYTLAASDVNKMVEMNVPTPNTITINSGVFTAGNQILFSQYGAGQVTIVAGSGVTFKNTKLKTNAQGSLGTIIAISASEFYISGDLTA